MKITTDHDEIRGWTDRFGGKPALVKGVAPDEPPLGIQFYDNPDFEPVGWEEFFDSFDTARLAFRYDEKAVRGSEDFAYSFIAREPSDAHIVGPGIEDAELVRENVFPSARKHGDGGDAA